MSEQSTMWFVALSFIPIIVYIILCFVVASFAGKRGHSYAGFFLLSFFLSPIAGIIVALLMPANVSNIEQTQYQSGDRRKCPFCAELVASEAKICKHCQRELPAIAPSEDGPKIIEIQNIERATGIRLKINDLQDGEAQTAGIRRGDIILSYGGVKIHSIEELSSALIKFSGSQVQLVILRGMEEYGCYFTVSPLEAASTSFLGIMKSGLLAVELEDGSNQQVVSAQAERDAQAVITQATSAPQSKATIYAVVGALIFAAAGGVGYWGLTQQKTAESSGSAMISIPGKNYELGKYEVTQGEWQAVMGSKPSHFSNCGDTCPVENVSWNDAQEFIQKLNAQTGKQYRLPMEAEWEYACYGGSQTEYCGGGNLDAVGWYDGNSGDKTHPAGQKQANGYGLYDMSGNVLEWMQDCSGGICALRGGSWYNLAQLTRAAYRYSNDPANRSISFGFRLARTLP